MPSTSTGARRPRQEPPSAAPSMTPFAATPDAGPEAPRLLASAGEGRLTTLSRGLSILEFVAKAGRFVRLRDVAEHFGLDRSAALRFLRTLELDGYLARHQAMKMYSLGPKLLSFPRLPPGVEPMVEAARPVLVRLGREAGQISHLAVLSGQEAVLVEVATSNARVSIKQAVGDLEPLYTSAVGKAIFAFLPEAERRAIGSQIAFRPFTARTIADLDGLEAEGHEVRATGVAFDRQEGNDQVCCVGCPILDRDGYPVASIGLSYVRAHLRAPIDEMVDDIRLVLAAAREIEASVPGRA